MPAPGRLPIRAGLSSLLLPRCDQYYKGDWSKCEARLDRSKKGKAERSKTREGRKAEVAAEVARRGTFSKGEGDGEGHGA